MICKKCGIIGNSGRLYRPARVMMYLNSPTIDFSGVGTPFIIPLNLFYEEYPPQQNFSFSLPDNGIVCNFTGKIIMYGALTLCKRLGGQENNVYVYILLNTAELAFTKRVVYIGRMDFGGSPHIEFPVQLSVFPGDLIQAGFVILQGTGILGFGDNLNEGTYLYIMREN